MKRLFFSALLLFTAAATNSQNKNGQNIQLGPMQTIWEMSDQNGNLPDWFSTTETNVRAIEHSLSETIAYLYVLVYEDGQPHIKVLDARTGTFIKELSMLGVSGGLLPLNRLLSIGGEKLLACNLTEKASDNPFKVYYWETEDSDPTVIITENESDLILGHSISYYVDWNYTYSFIVPASNSNVMLKFDSDQLYNFTKTTINLEGEPLGDAPSSVCMNVWDYYDGGYYVMINSYGDSSRYYSINGDIYCTIPSNILPLNSSSLDAYWDGGTLCCDFPAVFASLPENNTIKAIQSWGWYDPQNFEQNGYFSDFSPSLGNNPNPEFLSDITYRFYGPLRDTLYIFSLFGNNGLACYWWIGAAAPVELNYFTASVNGNNVKLQWETATETNNRGFYIERKYQSNDDVWTEIGFIEGAGTTSEKQTYSFTDRGLQPGKYLYRLKQVDIDGSYEFLKEIEAEIELPQSFTLGQNYPNPFGKNQNAHKEITIIPYSLREDAFVKLEIFNLVGEKIETLINSYQSAGFHEVSFNGTLLSSGTYYYKLSVNEKYIVKKMILRR